MLPLIFTLPSEYIFLISVFVSLLNIIYRCLCTSFTCIVLFARKWHLLQIYLKSVLRRKSLLNGPLMELCPEKGYSTSKII